MVGIHEKLLLPGKMGIQKMNIIFFKKPAELSIS